MADMLKITSPVTVKNRIDNMPKRQTTDAIFDIFNSDRIAVKDPKTQVQQAENEGPSAKQMLLENLNKDVLLPLRAETKAQADELRKFVLMAGLFEKSGIITEEFLSKLFVRPNELLQQLLTKDKEASLFKGEMFDSLRLLAKMEGQSELKEAIVSVLKHYEALVNRENSLTSLVKQTEVLIRQLPKSAAQQVSALLDEFNAVIKQSGSGFANDNFKEVIAFLKNTFIPVIAQSIRGYQTAASARDAVQAVIHYIVRYDQSDPELLDDAMVRLGNELKPLAKITDDDVRDMRRLIFDHAREAREKSAELMTEKAFADKMGVVQEEADLPTLVAKALEKDAPAKLQNVAQNMLAYMLQTESPVLPLVHFLIPFRFLDENTYGEFFINKDCEERKGSAKEAKNIFFIIQSDKYGNFEVDLLEREKTIDLDIRCPDALVERVQREKDSLRAMIQEQGYRLAAYQVDVYKPGQTIAARFPKLATGKVGIDVKV